MISFNSSLVNKRLLTIITEGKQAFCFVLLFYLVFGYLKFGRSCWKGAKLNGGKFDHTFLISS